MPQVIDLGGGVFQRRYMTSKIKQVGIPFPHPLALMAAAGVDTDRDVPSQTFHWHPDLLANTNIANQGSGSTYYRDPPLAPTNKYNWPIYGINGGINWRDSTILNFATEDWTIEASIYFHGGPSFRFVQKNHSVSNKLYIDMSATTVAFLMNGAGWTSFTMPELSPNQWYHIAITYDVSASRVRVYIDGVKVIDDSLTILPHVQYQNITAWSGASVDMIQFIPSVIYDANFIPSY